MFRKRLTYGICVGGLLLLPVAIFLKNETIINWTPSEPRGLYLEVKHSQMAEICLTGEQEQQAANSGETFLLGRCPGGHSPTLKGLFYATKEDPVVFSEYGFNIGDRLLINTAPLSSSSAGIPLAHIQFKKYDQGIFAISTHNSHSYDSRYFGTIESSQIYGYAFPIFAF